LFYTVTDMQKIAVLIPCYNEGTTIGNVVREFRNQLPSSVIYVYDNNSTDNTAAEARAAGAVVRAETRQGKGNVIRTMFREVEADMYVMVDGDGTYPAGTVHDLLRPIIDGRADMVIGSRLHPQSQSQFRWVNHIGNKIFLFFLNGIFRVSVTDLLSGYRAFSRRALKSLPVLSRGFEIETELTVKAIERRYRIVEIPVNLSPRPRGSSSKIHIFRDGVLILATILALFRDYKPLTAFGAVGLSIVAAGMIPGLAGLDAFLSNGAAVKSPLLILSVGLVLAGLLVIVAGIVLHTMSRRFQELDYLFEQFSDIPRGMKSGDDKAPETDR